MGTNPPDHTANPHCPCQSPKTVTVTVSDSKEEDDLFQPGQEIKMSQGYDVIQQTQPQPRAGLLKSYFGSLDQLEQLRAVGASDANFIHEREQHYKGSWIKRGGPEAFYNLSRKWDRIEEFAAACHYDVIKAWEDRRDMLTGLHEDVKDLRRYLMLLEAVILQRDKFESYDTQPPQE